MAWSSSCRLFVADDKRWCADQSLRNNEECYIKTSPSQSLSIDHFRLVHNPLCHNIDLFIKVSIAFYFGMAAAAADKGDESSTDIIKTM